MGKYTLKDIPKLWIERTIRKFQKTDYKSLNSDVRDLMDDIYGLSQSFSGKCILYDKLRAQIPLLGAAVSRIIRLIGEFHIEADNPNIQKDLNNFVENIQVNQLLKGLHLGKNMLADSALVKGVGVGEIIPTSKGIKKLIVVNANDIRFRHGKNNQVQMYQTDGLSEKHIKFTDNILYLTFNHRDGNDIGSSLFEDIPFISDFYVKTIQAMRNTVWRVGNPVFVTLVEGGENSTMDEVKGVAGSVARQIVSSMKAQALDGSFKDINQGVPDDAKIRIETLGTDFKELRYEIRLQTALEQITGATGLAPFMLGLYKWQTTATLSRAQTEQINSMIHSYRNVLESMCKKIINIYLIYTDRPSAIQDYKINWEEITFTEEVDKARAKLYRAQAVKNELISITQMVENNYISVDEVAAYIESIPFLSKDKEFQKDIIAMAKAQRKYKAQRILESIF